MEKLYSVSSVSTAVILFLILVSSTASASFTETRISTSGKAANPSISGNTVVWQDIRNGNSAIYMLDTLTKKEIHITDKSNQTNPMIYGNSVVWYEYPGINGPTIYAYDLSSHKETPTFLGDLGTPVIYGNKIVVDSEVGILMYDLSSKKITQIYERNGWEAINPAIDGNNIVWEGNPGEDGIIDIYMYDLTTHKETQISHSGTGENPAVYGNKVVWQDNRNGNYEIYMYDLSTKKETQITSNKFDQVAPVIYGNSIVWQDNRNGNWQIYAYDLVTHQQIHTTDKSDQTDPAIYSNKVVWTDSRSGKPDIYMGTISFLPVASFSASPITGNHPLNVQFTDKSTDAYYWSWDFGDKSTSTLPSPTHKYSKAGKYAVTLTVKNAAGSNSMKKTNYITVK